MTFSDKKNGKAQRHIEVIDLTLAYGDKVIQRDLNFTVYKGDIFIIMGGSGCGKSTLLKSLIGLLRPKGGKVLIGGVDFWSVSQDERLDILRGCGVLYQNGALWSSMTLVENITLPILQFTNLSKELAEAIASFKLKLVGLGGFEGYYPSEISGGMRKRAALARAMALDPEILYFDEPSAGLDPVSAKHLDDLIVELRDSLGATVVMVTHELASILSIGTNSVFLDPETKTMVATGDPKRLLMESDDPRIVEFLTRGTGKRGPTVV